MSCKEKTWDVRYPGIGSHPFIHTKFVLECKKNGRRFALPAAGSKGVYFVSFYTYKHAASGRLQKNTKK
ncbi:MAG: hypothetical protein IJL80_02805, partial [Treponema sp.]|nr:hypothetical protein [Treponema sp.]